MGRPRGHLERADGSGLAGAPATKCPLSEVQPSARRPLLAGWGATACGGHGGIEELPPPPKVSGAQVRALVQEDRLVTKNEEALFQWVVRWWAAGERPVAELLAAMKHVRFAAMEAGFLQTTVRAWDALASVAGCNVIIDSLSNVGHALPRSGCGPRLVYVLGGSWGGKLSTVDVYDPRADAWKKLSSMPTIRERHGGGDARW